MVALRMSFEENRIITMCQRPVMALIDIHEALEAGRGPENALDFLTMSIDRIVDRMGEVIAEIGDQVDGLEDAVIGGANDVQSLCLDMCLGGDQRIVVFYLERDVLNPGWSLLVSAHSR